MPPRPDEPSAIRLAEQILQLLDRGSFSATYKYAVLLGLMDLCLEKTSRDGQPPDMVTTRELAGKVLELYWPQTRPYDRERGQLSVLSQLSGGQAKIVSDILRFKQGLQVAEVSLHQAALEDSPGMTRLLDHIEWTLILMPLPRVQVVGAQQRQVLYRIGWGLEIERSKRLVSDYQRGRPSSFDNRILLLEGVGRPMQLGQKPRPLHELATTFSAPQTSQTQREKPRAKMPQPRNLRSSPTTCAGRLWPSRCSSSRKVSRWPATAWYRAVCTGSCRR